MTLTGVKTNFPPRLQALIVRSAALTQNQWYDAWTGLACAAGAGTSKQNVKILCIGLFQAVADETLVIRIIADNLDETLTQAAVAGTNYTIARRGNPDVPTLFTIETTEHTPYSSELLSAGNVKIMYRKTTAAGANNSTIRVAHALW